MDDDNNNKLDDRPAPVWPTLYHAEASLPRLTQLRRFACWRDNLSRLEGRWVKHRVLAASLASVVLTLIGPTAAKHAAFDRSAKPSGR